jgi:beta-lactam-binding protein with PASTA domain
LLFAENAVLEQLHKDKVIAPGTLIEKGSYIELIIGDGYESNTVKTPMLIGKKQKDAQKTIYLSTLNIGKEYFLDGRDTSHARIYRQEPSFLSDTLLSHGDSIDVWYRSDELFDFNEYLKSLLPETDSLVNDTINFN